MNLLSIINGQIILTIQAEHSGTGFVSSVTQNIDKILCFDKVHT